MSVVDDSFGYPLKEEEKAIAPMAGGILNHGFQCGMLWGAALAAGAQAHRVHGSGPLAEAEAIAAAERLVASFRSGHDHINCIDITNLDMKNTSGILKFLIKGGPIGCFRMAASYAPNAFDEIDAAISDNHKDAPVSPISCATVLAEKMGVSELHATMAAGLAGGIGLSGGACGALGAAIWITIMERNKAGGETSDYLSPEAMEVIDRFVESSDYEFECTEIVGRTFDSVEDHAEYVRAGGCSAIIEALARR